MGTVRKTSVYTAVVALPGASYAEREQRLDAILARLNGPIIAGNGHYAERASIFVRVRVASDERAIEALSAAISGPFTLSTGVGVNRREIAVEQTPSVPSQRDPRR